MKHRIGGAIDRMRPLLGIPETLSALPSIDE